MKEIKFSVIWHLLYKSFRLIKKMFTIKEQKKGEDSSVELSIIISEEEISKSRSKAIKHMGEHAELPGFRKGHIPENILVSKFGEQAILEEAAEIVIEENYPEIISEAKIQPVSHPKIIITKIAVGNPLEFSMTIDVMPKFDLPDYKSIAKKFDKEKVEEVTEKDIENVLEEIKRYHKKGDEDVEINDSFVKTLGDFKDVSDFKTKISENLKKEKEMQANQKRRGSILKAISEKTDIEIPKTFIERELDQMMNEFSHELSRMGQTLESYKTHAKKTDEEIKEEWKEKARTRVIQEIILQKIGDEEKIKPEPEILEKETKQMIEHYPDSPKERIVEFVEDMLTKQEVLKFLESQNK